jgi:hypothetical protein
LSTLLPFVGRPRPAFLGGWALGRLRRSTPFVGGRDRLLVVALFGLVLVVDLGLLVVHVELGGGLLTLLQPTQSDD